MLTILDKTSSTAEDAKLTLQVKSKLALEKGIPSGKISVDTNEGVVFLKGNVDFAEQVNKAVEIAGKVEGVKNVDASHLEVQGSSQPLTDTYITAKVKGVFLREKLFGDRTTVDFGIKVETRDGVVYLKGEVDNDNLERSAVSLARQVEGVKNVVSNIKIK